MQSGEQVLLCQDPLPRGPSGSQSRRNRGRPAPAAAQTFLEGPPSPSSDLGINSAASLPPGRGVLQASSQDAPQHPVTCWVSVRTAQGRPPTPRPHSHLEPPGLRSSSSTLDGPLKLARAPHRARLESLWKQTAAADSQSLGWGGTAAFLTSSRGC